MGERVVKLVGYSVCQSTTVSSRGVQWHMDREELVACEISTWLLSQSLLTKWRRTLICGSPSGKGGSLSVTE